MIRHHWKINTISGSAGGINGDAIVNAQILCKADTVEEVRLLLEAAPDLLNALQDCVTVIEEMVSDLCPNGDDPAARIFIKKAEAAIAKAKGAHHD